MAKINEHYLKLQAGYLFPEIARRVKSFCDSNAQADVIKMGIGDVTQPLVPAILEAMHAAIDEMGVKETFRGYGPEQGYGFLREAIAKNEYQDNGINIAADEIFVSDGSKCDTGNILEIFGEGPDKIGGVWAAQRIPDNHVGVSANISRIGELDLDNPDYFMASENVFDVAKDLGYWDGKETFKFWKAYSGKQPFNIREYFVLSSMAPSLNLKFDADELPFSVKVEKKVNIRDVAELYKATYDETEQISTWFSYHHLLLVFPGHDCHILLFPAKSRIPFAHNE